MRVFKTLSNIYDGSSSENNYRLLAVNYLHQKASIIDEGARTGGGGSGGSHSNTQPKNKKNNERFQRKNVKRILLFFWMIIDVYSLNQHHSRSFFIGIDS